MKFSEKMIEIETLVGRLEKEALPLEEALSLFEQGVASIRECQTYLREAKQRILLLSSDEREIPFSDVKGKIEENGQ
jgi:exodeoxyribonuclease VII small subunit